MKTLITKSNFISPYPTLSLNLGESQISDCVWRVQDSNLRELLGVELHNDLMTFFEIEKSVQNVIIGTNTAITLNNVADLAVGYLFSLKGILGTVGELLNGKQFAITAISGNNITIAVDSTGKTYTSGGVLEKVFTPPYKVLFGYLEPYLIYGAYANHVQLGAMQSTVSGVMLHSVGEAQHPTDKRIGEIVNTYQVKQRDYAKRILDFLTNNQATYPLFNVGESAKNETCNPSFLGLRVNRNLSNM